MIAVPFAPIGRETLRGFFDKLRLRNKFCAAFLGVFVYIFPWQVVYWSHKKHGGWTV